VKLRTEGGVESRGFFSRFEEGWIQLKVAL
jgi:hypothetical protein